MSQCALVWGAAMLVGASAWAQAAPQSSQANDPARPQVQTFEMVLGRAVENAGRNVARRVMEFAPDVMAVAYQTGDIPHVTGVAVRDMGLYVFHVQVPQVGLSLQVMNLMVNRPQYASRSVGPQQPVRDRVEAAGVVQADPMAQPGERTGRFDVNAEYRTQVQEVLVEAIIDNSGALPLGPNETLLVITGGSDPAAPNPFDRRTSPRLVLRAKASDLSAFREGRITRDEVKRRVLASDF
jgi:hypothetical protein